MLVIVEDGDIHFFLKTLLDDEAFRRLDVFKVDPTKSRTHQAHRVDECFGVFRIKFDVDGVHIREPFEQDGLALHHRFGRQRTEVAQTQNGRPVRDHGNKVALVGVIIRRLRVCRDRLAGDSNARRIRKRQIALRGHRNRGGNLELAGARLKVERKCFFGGDTIV